MNISILHNDRGHELSQTRTKMQQVNKNANKLNPKLLKKIQEVAQAIEHAGEDATSQVWKNLECPKLITAMLLSENTDIKYLLTERMKEVLEETDLLSDTCKQARIALRQEISKEGSDGNELTSETQYLIKKLLTSANELADDSFKPTWLKTANLIKALYDYYPELFTDATQGSTVLPVITDAVRLIYISKQPGYQNLGAATDGDIGPCIQELLDQAQTLSTIQKQVGAGSVEEIAQKIQELQNSAASAMKEETTNAEQAQTLSTIQKQVGAGSVEEIAQKIQELHNSAASAVKEETAKQEITKPATPISVWGSQGVLTGLGLGLGLGGIFAYLSLTRRNNT